MEVGSFQIKVSATIIMPQMNSVVLTTVVVGSVYVGYQCFKPLIVNSLQSWLGGERDDQEIRFIGRGSQIIRLRCFKDERFLEVYDDFTRGLMKTRLQTEFFKISYEIKELEMEILNMEEVNKTIEIIRKRYV